MGISKKQVQLGESNDEYVVVKGGLQENDEVYLSEPATAMDKKITLIAKAETNL